jgi:hypothetical protein
MARGSNEKNATGELQKAIANVSGEIERKRAEDEAFWATAPQLAGDWPQHWQNGWIYDFETLRMMVRRPLGAYKRPWDAMQIQAPRNVLAETSIDMWALSHADPETAKAVFLGQFLDAIQPNVPCMREDAVMNMVAGDGSECGTSLSWCYPFFCAASIHARCGDVQWLGQIYPRLGILLRWTVANRTDAAGFAVGKCSWETGMDSARRFLIEQPTGAELIEFIRIVELQAAMAHAGAVLETFGEELGDTRSGAEWKGIRESYTAKTQQLWNGADWFHDFDTRAGAPISPVGKDIGQVAPIFCGVATSEQIRAMVPSLRAFYEQSRAGSAKNTDGWVDGLQWSSLTLPFLESTWSAGEYELVSRTVHLIAERIYTSMDRRRVLSVEGSWIVPREGEQRIVIPGVSCEMWTPDGAGGGEGYGWGAVLPVHIMRNVVGIRESDKANELWFCPNLPDELMIRGKTYVLRGWRYREVAITISLSVQNENELEVRLDILPNRSLAVEDSEGRRIGNAGTEAFLFRTENRRRYKLRLNRQPGNTEPKSKSSRG